MGECLKKIEILNLKLNVLKCGTEMSRVQMNNLANELCDPILI